MRAEHENAFNVTSTAWAGDEGNHAWIILTIAGGQCGIGLGEVGDELGAAGENKVVGRQYAEHAATCAGACDADGACLGYEEIAFCDSGVAGLQSVFVVTGVDVNECEFRREQGR